MKNDKLVVIATDDFISVKDILTYWVQDVCAFSCLGEGLFGSLSKTDESMF